MRTRLLGALAAGLVTLHASSPAVAQADVAVFYAGKTITLIDGGGIAGGSALYSQAIAPLMRKYMPGNPTFVVQHMPGAGGARAANFVYSAAARDGTALGRPLQEMPLFALLGAAGLNYDPIRFQYIGGAYVARSTISVLKKNTKVRTIDDARRTEVILATGGKAAQPYMYPALSNALAGTKFKLVMGYPGTGAMNIAMDRGEVHGRAGSWNSFKGARPDWIEGDLLANLAVIGPDREPDIPDVPLLSEYINDPANRLIVDIFGSTALFGHIWLAPPGVPANRVAALREAFSKTLHDSELIALLKQRHADLNFVSWQQLDEAVQKLLKVDKDAVARLRAILDL